MRLSQKVEESNVSKATIKASAMAAVKDELELTDEELTIAARVGITVDELLQQKAMDRLEPGELLLLRTGMNPVEILASRIVR
jgi:hypothetical protein